MKVIIRTVGGAMSGLSADIDAVAYFQKLEALFASRLPAFGLIPDASHTVELSISVISEQEMRWINKEYRGIDVTTDVLSFPLWEEDNIFTPPDGWENLPLGDIVICPEVIARNAVSENMEFLTELTMMLCHGLLHLVGFDHGSDEQEKEMWNLQLHMTTSFLDGDSNAG